MAWMAGRIPGQKNRIDPDIALRADLPQPAPKLPTTGFGAESVRGRMAQQVALQQKSAARWSEARFAAKIICPGSPGTMECAGLRPPSAGVVASLLSDSASANEDSPILVDADGLCNSIVDRQANKPL